MSLSLGEKSKVSVSADLCNFAPSATDSVNPAEWAARLPHPFGGWGGWVSGSCWGCCLETRNITVCLSACLEFQGNLPGGGRSMQAFPCVPTAHVAQENGWSFKKGSPLPQVFLMDSSLAFSFFPPRIGAGWPDSWVSVQSSLFPALITGGTWVGR